MAQTKEQKAQAIDQLSALLDESPIVYLTNYSGLTVSQATELRDRFRQMGVQYRVIKNTLLKRAMERKGGFDELFEHLEGPTAVAFAAEPAAPARVIKKYIADEKIEIPRLKAAYVDGAIYHADALDVLAALKSKEELISDILGLLQSPITNIVGALQSAGSNLVGAVKSIAAREE